MTAAPPPPSLDAAASKRLASAADVARALGELATRERAIDARLGALLAGRADVERALARLGEETGEVREKVGVGGGRRRGRRGGDARRSNGVGPDAGWRRPPLSPPAVTPPFTRHTQALSSLRADATALAASINGTAALAERVSCKVRQLDTAQSRVRETLTHIDAAVGRAEAVDGLRAALAADDYEGAAARVAAFRDLEARFLSDGAAGGDDRQLREQHAVRKGGKGGKRGRKRGGGGGT